jgi:membrane protein DedA with SNARE-associated domain
MIEQHAGWILFLWVLANEGGVPLPRVPALLGIGALTGVGRLSIIEIVPVVVVATLCADLAWYGLGRSRGSETLALLARLSGRRRCASVVSGTYSARTWRGVSAASLSSPSNGASSVHMHEPGYGME